MPSVPTGTQPSGWATRGHESAASSGVTTAAGWSVAGTRGAPELPPRVHGSSGSLSIVALAMSAFGPLHRRLAPPPGRQRTTRRQSRSLSGPLRAFRPPGVPQGTPRKSVKCPSTPVPGAAGPTRFATRNRTRVHPPEHRRAGDVGIRTPPPPSGTAARPSADHSASESVSQRPPEGLPTPRCTPGYPPEIRKVPVNAGSQRRRLGAGPPHRRPPGPAIGGTRTLNINPTPAPRRRRGHHSQRITASLTQIRAPSTAVS